MSIEVEDGYKNKLVDKAIKSFNEDTICGIKVEELANEFVNYRKEIKKKVKTYRPIVMYLKELKKLCEAGFDIDECIEEMMFREWQTVKLEYFKKDKKEEPKRNFI